MAKTQKAPPKRKNPRPPQTREIDGFNVTVELLNPLDNLKHQARALALAAPLFAAIAAESPVRGVHEIRDGLRTLAEELDWLIDTFLEDATVTIGGGEVPFKVAMDDFRDGETLAQCIWFALEANYERFFERLEPLKAYLTTRLEAARKVVEAQQEAEATPTSEKVSDSPEMSTESGPSGASG
jgi:hypothetical protein